MAMPIAKPAGANAAKPQTGSSTPASSAGPKPNSSVKPNALLGRAVMPVTADARRAMIAEAAYYMAEQRGFTAGRDVEDWLLAEEQVDAALST